MAPDTAATVPAEGTWNQVFAEDAARSIDRNTTAAAGADHDCQWRRLSLRQEALLARTVTALVGVSLAFCGLVLVMVVQHG